jgi:hypothetical protein
LNDFEKEHIIPVFFRGPYRVCYVKSNEIASMSLSVDDIEDFERVAEYVRNWWDEGTLFQKLGFSTDQNIVIEGKK